MSQDAYSVEFADIHGVIDYNHLNILDKTIQNVACQGIVVNYTNFSQDNKFYNRQGLELLKDPAYENYNAHPWLSWYSVKIAIGVKSFNPIPPQEYLIVRCPYHSGGWRQLGACGGWSWYN